ncbi:MAG: S8 family serine peptidase [Thermoanaerobacteraceae bacterium]|nr:S8 family serine peptidase [Thermoanaerobacteraceae bacterium]
MRRKTGGPPRVKAALALLGLFLLTWTLRVHIRTNTSFLSDRAAHLTGAAAVAAPGVVAPEGLTGRGQIIGLADSGLDAGRPDDIHPDLQSSPGAFPKVVMLKSWAGRSVPDDPTGHGTHLAGLIAGTGAASGGKYRGIAPEASLYFQALLDEEGKISVPPDLEDLFRPAYAAGVRVHVNGWGGGSNRYSSSSRQVDAFVRSHLDFLPIFSAGNGGPVAGTLTAEANSKNALVVGAAQSVRPALSPDAQDASSPASFSSRGPAGDGRLKPDLLAPGAGLVGPRSRLVEGNFPAHSGYSLQSGTSQAAAVAGAAAALLRQYLQEEGMEEPSAALLKAALINGARPAALGSDPPGSVWGILDLAGTVLALEESTMHLVDETRGLRQGETAEFELEVRDPGAPLKVTLAWTDPPAPPGADRALVNDLDLVVVGPGGREYLGNDALGEGKPDRVNNVEQVYITQPPAGRYTVKVVASSVAQGAVEGSGAPRQDFALAYGQLLPRGVLVGLSPDGKFLLADGREIEWSAVETVNVVDGRRVPADKGHLLPGSDVYLGSRRIYVVGATWEGAGLQPLATSRGDMLVEIGRDLREGGFYLNPAAGGNVFLDGRPASLESLPPGVDVSATLNPSTGTLWTVEARALVKEGLVAEVNPEENALRLLHDDQIYRLSSRVAVSFADRLHGSALADLPFGAADKGEVEQIWPGMAVELALSARSGEVVYLAVKRDLMVGRIASVDASSGRLVLETGASLKVFPGAPLERDGREAGLKELKPGDWVRAVTLPEADTAVALRAYSRVLYGRVIYASRDRDLLYFIDSRNDFHLLRLGSAAHIYRWGLWAGREAVSPGDWVRVILDPQEDEIWRIDVAPVAGEKKGMLVGWDGDDGLLRLADGTSYPASRATLVTLGGYPVPVEDLPAGLQAQVVYLQAPGTPVLAQVAAEVPASSPPPELKFSVIGRGEGVYLGGTTTADRLYLYREDGRREDLTPGAGGHFAHEVEPLPSGETCLLVALDRRTGAVTGARVELGPGGPSFWDIAGHWAEEDIRLLARQGLLAGFEDGSFRPDLPVTRAEFVALLVRLAGWPVDSSPELPFTDAAEIPSWARGVVAAARERGLVVGFEDGTFRAGLPVTRAEAAALLVRYLGDRAPSPAPNPPFRDWGQAPPWSRQVLARAFAAGLLRGTAPDVLSPLSSLTRAQTAAVLRRLAGL